MFKVGIIGTNFGSKIYVPVMKNNKNFLITGISDNGSGSSEQIISYYKLSDCKAYSDFKDLIFSKDNNIICIVTPTYTHHKLIKLCIEAGKKIICEKPMGLSSLKKSYENDFSFFVNYHFRFNYLIMKIKSFFKKKKIGKIKKIKVQWFLKNPDIEKKHWKTNVKLGGSIKFEIFTHIVDYLTYILSKDIYDVQLNQNIKKSNNEIFKCKVLFSGIDACSINIKRNSNFSGSHKILIIGSKSSILLFIGHPFDYKSKYLIYFKNRKKKEIFYDNQKGNLEGDDRLNSFNNFLNKIVEDPTNKAIPNYDSANYVHKILNFF